MISTQRQNTSSPRAPLRRRENKGQTRSRKSSVASQRSTSSRNSPTTDPNLPTYQQILTSSPEPFSSMTIIQTQALPSHLHSLRRLALQDDSALHLQVSPPASVPLLRHERTELETEAATLRILSSQGLPVPRVLKHDTDPTLLGAPYLLTTSLPGIPLSRVLPSAPRQLRRSIDAQIDALEQRLAALSSPNFGPVDLVEKGRGWATWPAAFDAMLASVLKDGEDMFVNLPYAPIRAAAKLALVREALAEVSAARLCVGGLGGPDGVLVEIGKGVGAAGEGGPLGGERARVTGLVGCKVAWWGDRLLEIGSELWDEVLPADEWELVGKGGEGLGKEVRVLMYAVYHAVVDIVTSFYRPGREHMELGARRKLTAALTKISSLAAAHGDACLVRRSRQ